MVASLLVTPPRRIPPPVPIAPRAPRRAGERTTLRVPDDLSETIERYAQEHRTSTNDALIRLAYDGARMYDANREAAQLARVRRAAIRRPTEVSPDLEPPSAEETANAILAWRLGLVDEEEWGA